ncbi:16044_t:CDS:10 [Acaulospora morrowiae]|uniref:Geranylgeranyl transferase type-2 subunit alpha n=1 Tax=Acaulospora morrowiae TaxID=94023 RepID=A0A9N9C436_9GLOM|nr:16044_t:CDS:10 [Acaulospora morrowiae]
MHGVKRVKPSAEVERLRKEKEAVKIKEYNRLIASCFAKKTNSEYDVEAFNITTKILSQNPDFYTIWNFRRTILLNTMLKDCSAEEKQQELSSELLFLQEVFRLNPKSYWIFNHRRWCLETMPTPDWQGELTLVGRILDMDSRNFHAWDYRRYVISKLSSTEAGDTEIRKNEFDFTTTKINQNFSNYSAWHQRSKLLPRLIKEKHLNDQERKKMIDREFELVKSAFYTDPDDQSAWLYHWWLIGREIRHLSILGAYYNPKKAQIILSFDDEIGMLTPFRVLYKYENSTNVIKGDWRSVDGEISNEDRMYGFVWVFTFSGEEMVNFSELVVTVKPEWIVTSHPEKKLARTISRCCNNGKFKKDKDILVLMTPKDLNEGVADSMTDMLSDLMIESPDLLLIDTPERLAVLRREISAIRELLDLEPDSKWCLQTLVNLLCELKHISGINSEEIAEIEKEVVILCDRLIHIDKIRTKRFEDLRSKAIFESSTRILIESSNIPSEVIYKHKESLISESTQISSFSLADQKITIIPLPSIFLHIRKLDLSLNKLKSIKFLANLINLQEANLSKNCITNIQGVHGLEFLRHLDVRSNLIENWESIKNELKKWQGDKCKVYLYGNPFVEISNDLLLEQRKVEGRVEIVWDDS